MAESDTASFFRSGDVPVLATPRLIALCEEATCRATDGHLTALQSSVATRVQFDHLAAVAIGSVVWPRRPWSRWRAGGSTFTVSAARLGATGAGSSARGRVTRVVLDRAAFLAKADAAGES